MHPWLPPLFSPPLFFLISWHLSVYLAEKLCYSQLWWLRQAALRTTAGSPRQAQQKGLFACPLAVTSMFPILKWVIRKDKTMGLLQTLAIASNISTVFLANLNHFILHVFFTKHGVRVLYLSFHFSNKKSLIS